jgi:hypothetical protein
VNYQSFNNLNKSITSKKSLSSMKSVQRQFPYLNITGPGQYDTVGLTGGSLTVSNKRNAPNFSFGIKGGKNSIISK